VCKNVPSFELNHDTSEESLIQQENLKRRKSTHKLFDLIKYDIKRKKAILLK
jgi:hypothetical protein